MIPTYATDPIELDVNDVDPIVIAHGLGRQIRGWDVIWATGPVSLYVPDPNADTRNSLTLKSNGSARVRLVLL